MNWWKKIFGETVEIGKEGAIAVVVHKILDGVHSVGQQEIERRTKPREKTEAMVLATFNEVEAINPVAANNLRRRHALRQDRWPRTYNKKHLYGPLDEGQMIDALGIIYSAHSPETTASKQTIIREYERLGAMNDEDFDKALEMLNNDNMFKVLRAGWESIKRHGGQIETSFENSAKKFEESQPRFVRWFMPRRRK